jgi:hypothetical protein
MDTEEALRRIAAILKTLRIREVATIDDISADTNLPIRTLSRFLSYLRETNRIDQVNKDRVAVGVKVLYMPTTMIETREKEKSSSIKRNLLGSNEWKRGEHCGFAAFWPPAAAPARAAAR